MPRCLPKWLELAVMGSEIAILAALERPRANESLVGPRLGRMVPCLCVTALGAAGLSGLVGPTAQALRDVALPEGGGRPLQLVFGSLPPPAAGVVLLELASRWWYRLTAIYLAVTVLKRRTR